MLRVNRIQALLEMKICYRKVCVCVCVNCEYYKKLVRFQEKTCNSYNFMPIQLLTNRNYAIEKCSVTGLNKNKFSLSFQVLSFANNL